MPSFSDFENNLGGNQIISPYNGLGQYNPFPRAVETVADIGGSGGGGGVYQPPVPPNNIFVPPSYTDVDFGKLTIHMSSAENAEFLENNVSVGIGPSTKIEYRPALKFGNSKTYEARATNRKVKNYFVVSVEKTYNRNLIDTPNFNDRLNPDFGNVIVNRSTDNFLTGGRFTFLNQPQDSIVGNVITRNDIFYKENLVITEFVLNESTGEYNPLNVRNLRSTDGIVNLEFGFIAEEIIKDPIDDNPPTDETVSYNLNFVSNYANEIGNYIKLKYQIVSPGGDLLQRDDVLLSDGNIDSKTIKKSALINSKINLEISEFYETARILVNQNNLPEGFSYSNFYWAPKVIADKFPADYTQWNKVAKAFNISGKEFLSEITVAVVFEKSEKVLTPSVSVGNFIGEYEIKESDTDKIIEIPFTTQNAEFVDVYITETSPIRIEAGVGVVRLSFNTDFGGVFGNKKVFLVPVNRFGIGNSQEVVVKFISVNDFPSITQITLADSIDVPSFSDLNVEFDVSYNSFAATSIDVFVLKEDNSRITILTGQTPNGSFKVNLKTIIEKFLDGKKIDLTFVFVPYNNGGFKQLVGNPYEVKTKINYPGTLVNENEIKYALFDAISNTLGIVDLPQESKYLTHLVNFGNNEQILISSWEEDDWTLSEKREDELGNLIVTNKVDSILVKLYSPLPASVTTNSTFWITKLMTNPLIETVVLNEQDSVSCPPIKGPNFTIEIDYTIGNSTSYESLDNLILNGPSSNELVGTYLSSSLINTDDLNIEYYKGTNYLTGSIVWENFTHFSSAKERVDNFVYKVQLIEKYEEKIADALAANTNVGDVFEIERQTIKKNQIINGFDGFEKFLYTSASLLTSNDSNSITWPYSGTTRINSSNLIVFNWYEKLGELAENYDTENPNYLKNNIPQYILENNENDSFLLFFSMIGQHFDNIYYYTKSIERSRGLSYKSKGGISDKLLFDTLKSFSWNAKNLAADEKLWKYVFGQDDAGNTKETNPAKARTNEVWRRIVNNIPYLLKHKGTRRGVYALMACYGIPSSNLSILEFGGPEGPNAFAEESEIGTTKVTFDTTTYALNLTPNAKIKIDWIDTDKNERPKTIETFIKPAYYHNWTVLSGSAGWDVALTTGSVPAYGRIKVNSGGTTLITSEELPIFNDRFFGISISSGSFGIKLDTKQVDGERTIFEKSYTSSLENRLGPQGDELYLGWNFSGSVDEFRLWSTTLSSSVFNKHVFFPEAINGNHISSSTDDLYFRLDFEYPKNLAQTSSLINVDTNIYFSSSVTRNELEGGIVSIISGSTILSENANAVYSGSASGFTSITTYPYNFEPIERTVTMEVPNVGSSRYSSNKVRFESQTDVFGNPISKGIDLSAKGRATKKSFDQAPIDSNRVGLFFSPTKELNTDIIKSFGGINLDNYIGDPSDMYKDKYQSLDKLRNYYFQRFDSRDIYAYINLIKAYEKSLFEDIKKMLPARVRATTGLLIEPHILERSKIEQSKPIGEDYQQNGTIDTREHVNGIADNNQFETIVDADLSENIIGENNQYDAIVSTASVETVIAENYQYTTSVDAESEFSTIADYYQKEVIINAGLDNGTAIAEVDLGTTTNIGESEYEKVGFGIYAQNGVAIRTYYDAGNNIVKERIRVSLVTEEKERIVQKFAVTASNGFGDPRGGFVSDIQTYTETKLNIQPFINPTTGLPTTIPSVGGPIVSVKSVDGYLPTHYRNTSDLTRGLQNSFYKGSKNTAATTLDGSSPVETFTTNPNTLRVNKAGRDASEPILEVE